MSRAPEPVQAVLFDLDGTLIDSTGDLADGANAARAAFGLPPLPEAAVAPAIGHGLGHLLRGTLPEALHPRLDEARAAFHAHYDAHLLHRTRPYPGAAACLDHLTGSGVRLGMVTNKPGRFVAGILEGLGWATRFEVVVAGDTLPQRKPSPEPIRHAMDALGAVPARTHYVGDTEVDLECAAAAGVPFVCVAWGRAAADAQRTTDDLGEWARQMTGEGGH